MSPEDSFPIQNEAISLMQKDAELAQLLPFEELSQDQAEDILSQASVRRVPANATYFNEGDSAKNFYLLLDGVLRVVQVTEQGEQVVILHVVPGKMFGIAKAFENDTYHATARAASEGVALSWPSEVWDEFIAKYPGFLQATRSAVGERVEEMQEKIVEMATLQVEQRIAHAILRLVRQTGKETEQGIEIDFPLTRQDISEMTGTTLHSVSRYMSKWQKDGIVNSGRRRVVVCRPQDLPV
ncbi:MAG: Crp/Fnr family transcriptional regulator [Litoreibacter sp.]|nr:Crp/Fnr family transcriptional regulator [Litoreibacter sp.]